MSLVQVVVGTAFKLRKVLRLFLGFTSPSSNLWHERDDLKIADSSMRLL